LDFWSLVDTHNSVVKVEKESWLGGEINNPEVYKDDYTTFRGARDARLIVHLRNKLLCLR
jgi:hypothetical protein